MNWDDLRFFLAVARSGSLSAAARALGVNQSTVSRRLAAMEERLGARLVERRAGTQGLTAAGARLEKTARAVEEEVASLDRQILGEDTRLTGRLRVTCTDNFLNRYLAPHFARFVSQHPDIDLDVLTGYQHLSLARREADVAIRTTLRPPETLAGKRLLHFALAVYAAPGVVADLGPDPDPADLEWIGWDNDAYNRIMITDHYPRARIRHRVDSLLDMASLAREGLGVATLGCFSADPDPGLERVFAAPIVDNAMDLWVLWHPDMRRTARVRVFTAFISEAILSDRDLFEGMRTRS